ncbi:MAG: M20/M25/M40 family metallo-hydrolase [Acidobacteriota bacterium]
MPSKKPAAELERLDQQLSAAAARLRNRLVQTIGELVQIPSQNTAPVGAELKCQHYVHERLEQLGLKAELYDLPDVARLANHSAFRTNRDYTNRPNVAAVWPGSGGGKSLLLSGHVDTVPIGSEPWIRDPFGAIVEGNRLYGLGSNDMKGGIGAILVTLEVLKEAGVRLRGDLLVETVVDEEFGGVNGTLAARLRGHNADAAIVCEPSQQAICPAQMGGRTAHITLRSHPGGILSEGAQPVRVTEQLHYVLGQVEEFARRRRASAPVHALYAGSSDPVPVWVTKVFSGGWGTKEPITVPASCKIELYWQLMPGEKKEEIDREFFQWFDEIVSARPELFPVKPEVSFPIAWLPGSSIDGRHELVVGLSETFQEVTGVEPPIRGIGGPCDMFVFHQHFNTPAVLFGPRGGNTHAPDEWVDLNSALTTVEVLARFVCRWCGVN